MKLLSVREVVRVMGVGCLFYCIRSVFSPCAPLFAFAFDLDLGLTRWVVIFDVTGLEEMAGDGASPCVVAVPLSEVDGYGPDACQASVNA